MNVCPLLLLAINASPAQTAPNTHYDRVRDLTLYSTGTIKFRSVSSFWCEAGYVCTGHQNYRPDNVLFLFSASRLTPDNDVQQDSDVATWQNTQQVTLRFADTTHTYPATYSKTVGSNALVKALVGRTFIEQLRIQMPIDDFVKLAESDDVLLALGDHEDELKGKNLNAFARLVQFMPGVKASSIQSQSTGSNTAIPVEDPNLGHERYKQSTAPKYLDGVTLTEKDGKVLVDGSAPESRFCGTEIILAISIDKSDAGFKPVKTIADVKAILTGKVGTSIKVKSHYGTVDCGTTITVKFNGSEIGLK